MLRKNDHGGPYLLLHFRNFQKVKVPIGPSFREF